MDKQNKQRLEQLVRQGLVPSRKLPMLMKAMSSLHMGKQLSPTERDVLAKYMHNMTDIMLKDDTVFNRAKLHTQKTKYQTEDTTVGLDEKTVDGVEIVDGPEEEMKQERKKKKKDKEDKDYDDKDNMKENVDPDEEERTRKKADNKARRISIRRRDRYRMLPAEIKKERQKAGLDEDIAKMNEDYKDKFEAALTEFGVSNIRDLPADKKQEFFNHVDASHDVLDETITAQHLKMAKGIAFDKRYAGTNYSGAEKAMEKVKKGLSSHPEALKHLKHANESYLSVKPNIPDSNAARAAALNSIDRKAQARADMKAGKKGVKKEEFETKESVAEFDQALRDTEIDPFTGKELIDTVENIEEVRADTAQNRKFYGTMAAINKKHGEDNKAKGLVQVKKTNDTATSLSSTSKWVKKDSDEHKDHLKRGYVQQEEVELTFEEMTPAQKADRLKMIANSQKRVDSGDAARDAEKRAAKAAKADMRQKGAQKGMASTKKDVVYDKDDKRGVVEDIQQLRKVIKEGSAKEKIEAYKELNRIIEQYKTTGEL